MLSGSSIPTLHARADELRLQLRSTPEELNRRIAEDDHTMETLRSFAAIPVSVGGVDAISAPKLQWLGQRAAPEAPSIAPVGHSSRTWVTTLDAPRVVPDGPLTGFEVGIKDLMQVEGITMTAATRAHRAVPSAQDATAVSALRAAGATIRGTTNLHALAYGATGVSSDWGMPDNPAAPGMIPGGSSSGSASAVADGSAALTLGTDTSGSIRIPAALCGVVGYKPSRGLVGLDGCHPLSPSLDHIGPLSRSVDVTAAAMAALAGWQGWQVPQEPGDVLRVGLLTGYFDIGLDPRVRRSVEEAASRLADSGAELDQVDLPLARHIPGAQLAILGTEALASNLTTLRERGQALPPDVRLRLEAGLARTPAQYEAAHALRERWQAQVDGALRHHHFLLCPTTAITAPPVGVTEVEIDGRAETVQFSLTRLTMPFNLSGHPAITLPFHDSTGTLVGLQLIGRIGGDQDLLAAAAHVEQLLG